MPSSPRLKKRYGQHHLRHAGLCRPLLDFLRPRRQLVVEIGPGGGVLTAELVRGGARVWAWELDAEWALRLAPRMPGPALSTVVGDALEIPWERLPPDTQVTGNLPYAISTRLVRELLARAPGVTRAGFLVQAEVGRRLVARVGDGDYGALSVLVQARAEAVLLGRVRRTSFRPPPKVDGAFIGLSRRSPLVAEERWPGFEAFVRLAFAQRRKTLRNALAARWRHRAADALLAESGLGTKTRAAELDLQQLIAVYRAAERLGLT